jgi:uncharacterized protein YbaP (TraB family)
MNKIFLELLFLALASNLNAQQTVLWEITHEAHDKVSYLMGTMHPLGAHFITEHPVIREKLLAAQLVVFETIDEPKVDPEITSRPDDFSYREVLKRKSLLAIETMAKDWKYPLSKLRPPELMVKLEKEYLKYNCGNYEPGDSLIQLDDYLRLSAENADLPLF